MNRVVFHDKKLIVTVPHKAGSTSFQAATTPGLPEVAMHTDVHVGDAATAYWKAIGIGPLSLADVLRSYPNYRRLMAVREPVSRFMSTWDDFCLKQRVHGNWHWLRGLSQSDFMGLIEACPGGNQHWWPQSFSDIPNSEYIQCGHLLPYLGLEDVHLHVGTRAEGELLSPSLVERIRRHYARDFELWEMALEFDFEPSE